KNTTYTLTVTDSVGCTRTATTSLNASPIAVPTLAAGPPDCAGKTTLTATPSGLASYTWFDGSTSIGTTNPLTATLPQDGKDHSITVTATDSAGCSNTSAPTTVHINLPVSVSGSAGTPDCKGNVTLTATASGGAAGFTYQWFDGASSIGTGSPLTVALPQ